MTGRDLTMSGDPEYGATSWQHFQRFGLNSAGWPSRDRFVLSRGHSVMPLRTIRCLTDVKTPGEDEEHLREPSATFDDIMGFGRLDSPCKVRASKRQPNSWARTARPTPILLTADRHIRTRVANRRRNPGLRLRDR